MVVLYDNADDLWIICGIIVLVFVSPRGDNHSRIVTHSGFSLFRQLRTGKDGRSFLMYKFRTMAINAEKLRQKYIQKNESEGPTFKIANDPRFIPLGKFLSHTGLDELPQLLMLFGVRWRLSVPDRCLFLKPKT